MCPNLQETADLVTFTEEILNEKLHFLCNVQDIQDMCQNQDNLGEFLVIFKFQDILRFQNFLATLNVPMSMICYLPFKGLIEISFFQLLCCRTVIFKNSFLPDTINDWNRLDPKIRKIDLGFWKKLLSFVRPTENKIFGIYYPLGINRLIVGFSHLN